MDKTIESDPIEWLEQTLAEMGIDMGGLTLLGSVSSPQHQTITMSAVNDPNSWVVSDRK